MNALELKMPPIGVLLISGIGMWLLANLTPSLTFPWPGNIVTALALLGAGAYFGLAAIVALRKAKTTTNSTKPAGATSLVTSGIYAYSRNPMYFAMLLILIAWAVYQLHFLALLFLPLYVGYTYRFQIVPEERALAEKFGQSYTDYLISVPRWI